MTHDYLKFWRIIRYYVKAKYGITQEKLELLFFLRHEGYFDGRKFKEFEKMMKWSKDRLLRMVDEGWVEIVRMRKKGVHKAIYKISPKGYKLVDRVYRLMHEEELMLTDANTNPLFKASASWQEKRYARAILKMNEYIRNKKSKGLQQRRAPE